MADQSSIFSLSIKIYGSLVYIFGSFSLHFGFGVKDYFVGFNSPLALQHLSKINAQLITDSFWYHYLFVAVDSVDGLFIDEGENKRFVPFS